MSSTWDSNQIDWVDTTWENAGEAREAHENRLKDDEYKDEDYE
jgi:hypothetical protein